MNQQIDELMTKGSHLNLVLTNLGFAMVSHVLTYPRCKKNRLPSFHKNNRVYDILNLASSYWEIPDLPLSL